MTDISEKEMEGMKTIKLFPVFAFQYQDTLQELLFTVNIYLFTIVKYKIVY